MGRENWAHVLEREMSVKAGWREREREGVRERVSKGVSGTRFWPLKHEVQTELR